MRIAIVTYTYYPLIGGQEVFAQEVAEHFVKKGWEVDIITMYLDKSLKKLENINNVMVHRIGMGKIKYLSFLMGYFRLVCYLLRLDKGKKYDLIHAVGDGHPSIITITIKKLKRKPGMITIQGGCISAGFKSNLSGRISRKLQEWSFKNADLVHVISQSLAERAKKLGAENIVIIPNGVDSRLFKPMGKKELRKKYGISAEEKIIISVARLDPVKGVDYLIKATALVGGGIPDLRLIVIGDGEQRKQLEELINRLYLDSKVHLLGFLSHQQISEYLNMSDVFVLPSRHEGLGIALIEAMACGVPVIGSRVDGIPDVIDDGKNGILVPPGDVNELAEAIERLLRDKNLRDNFTKAGFEKVQERFLWNSILQQIEQIYIDLTETEQKRGRKK